MGHKVSDMVENLTEILRLSQNIRKLQVKLVTDIKEAELPEWSNIDEHTKEADKSWWEFDEKHEALFHYMVNSLNDKPDNSLESEPTLKPEFQALADIRRLVTDKDHLLAVYNGDRLKMANEVVDNVEIKLNKIAGIVDNAKVQRYKHGTLEEERGILKKFLRDNPSIRTVQAIYKDNTTSFSASKPTQRQ